jgi:hypothetical protein
MAGEDGGMDGRTTTREKRRGNSRYKIGVWGSLKEGREGEREREIERASERERKKRT